MISRRALLVSALAAASVRPPTARAQAVPASGSGATTAEATILRLQPRTIEVNGKLAPMFAIRQPDGTNGIITEVGKPFRVHLENNIDQPSLIHWHGLTPPYQQDGVPGISGPPIPPGGSADYDFPLRFGGTFWMHSHQGLQGVVTGIGFIGAGAIIRQGDFTTGHATAASIWTVGIMGAAVGYGYYDIGIILTAANLAVLMLRPRSPGTFIGAREPPGRMLTSARRANRRLS